MSAPDLASSSHRARIEQRKLLWLAPIPFQLGAVAYLCWVVGPTGAETAGLLFTWLASAALGSLFLARGAVDLGGISTGIECGADELSGRTRDAIEDLGYLPSRVQRTLFLSGLLPVGVVPLVLGVFGESAWLGTNALRSLVLVGFTSAALTSHVIFYWMRDRVAALQVAIAATPAGAVVMSDPAPSGSLANRLQVAVAIPVFASLLMVVDVASHGARRAAEEEALAWLGAAVEAVAEADGSLPLGERVARQLPQERFWPMPTRTFEVDRRGVKMASPVGLSDEFVALIGALADRERSAGPLVPSTDSDLGVYRRLDDGRLLIATVARADLDSGAGLLGGGVFWVGLVMGLIALVVGSAISRDLTRSIGAIRNELTRLASGDLRASALVAPDDEWGEVTRSLFGTVATFRKTLEHASAMAVRVEGTVSGLATVLSEIAGSSAQHSEQARQAKGLLAEMNDQVGRATRSAADLTDTIDESSNSVLELGAAGDELNETASVLTSKVDAVSDSLEQMVRSVKQVGATTDRLAEASEETSSSMEQMASAMRAVDTSAATTANLSRDVVDKAELGQAKVVQTIAGMEAIRDATDTAESVIRGLGARTSEIGGILDVIEDVADETNLLALNAAIIAAQAGEQGKAFSVVADEIKELADRVLASTKEIGGLIRSVQEESENAIGAIEAGSASVMSGVDLSAEAGRTLEEITDASRESGTRISEIVNSVREQTKAASHVVALMERVRDSADQIGAAGAEQERGNEVVYRSALTMREVAQQVRRTTEDQAAGFGRIRDNVAGVRGAVGQISGSLLEQSEACTKVTGFLDGFVTGSQSNATAAETLREGMRELVGQAEELREDVERFRC